MAPDPPSFKRFALYYLGEGDELSQFGASWLGWDCATGKVPPAPDLPGLPRPLSEITARPRPYGFHATIVPPFRLLAGTEETLRQTLRAFCARTPAITLNALELVLLGRFLALVPKEGNAEIQELATAALQACDAFRAPPESADLQRHRAKSLSPAQDALLTRWGYPYVMEAFRFHFTLTGKLPKPEARTVQQVLGSHIMPLVPKPFRITQLALVGEDTDGWFHLIEQAPLLGQSSH